MNELISIIIPVYNVDSYLEICVQSVLNQSYKTIEIILVDDGSTDSSGVICDKLARNDRRVRVIHKPNGGLSDARNIGIKNAKGDYFFFVDSDDQIDLQSLEYLYELLKEHDSEIAICDLLHCYTEDVITYNYGKKVIDYSSKDAIIEMLYQKSFLVSACGKLFAKKCFDDISFPVGIIYEDSAVMYKIFERASSIVYSDAKLYAYMHRNETITTKKFSFRNFDILDICDDIVNHYADKDSDIRMAADAYQVNAALRIYMTVPEGDEYIAQKKRAMLIIKTKGHAIIHDNKIRSKMKIALYMYFHTRPLMKLIYNRIDRWK